MFNGWCPSASARTSNFGAWTPRASLSSTGGRTARSVHSRSPAPPARHFSGRGLGQVDSTLWSSWSIVGPKHRVFYSGDTALHPAFKDIGARFGPFDLTLMETGAYSPLWHDVHLGPEQAVIAHQLVRGRVMLPVHWGDLRPREPLVGRAHRARPRRGRARGRAGHHAAAGRARRGHCRDLTVVGPRRALGRPHNAPRVVVGRARAAGRVAALSSLVAQV